MVLESAYQLKPIVLYEKKERKLLNFEIFEPKYVDLRGSDIMGNIPLSTHEEFDADLNVYTLTIINTGIYGEGDSAQKAFDDLIENVIDFSSAFLKEEVKQYAKNEIEEDALNRLLDCNSDTFKIKKLLYKIIP